MHIPGGSKKKFMVESINFKPTFKQKSYSDLNFVKLAPLIAFLKVFRGTNLSQRGRHEWLCELICNYFVNFMINSH